MPKSGKEIAKLFKKKGYERIKGQGKGSHMKFKKKGRSVVVIPDHKELKKGMEHALLKRLKEEK